jgi:UDP-arabinose 4-epimerase
LAADVRTVLVTGGAGYIGSHAAKALSRAGYRVVVYDSLIAGHREAVKYGPLVEGDIADVGAVRDAIRRHQVLAVMHFAAFLDVGESVREPARYYRNNVIGALGVLEAMAAESVKYFVLSSTCATYGEPRETPILETHSQHPVNSYGETKLAIERALPHFERAHGLRWMSLRYFNAAGADPDGEIRVPSRRRPEARACSCSVTIIRRRTAPACATISTCPTLPTPTYGRSTS